MRPTVLHMCVQGVGLEAVHGLGSRRSAWKVTADVLKVTVAVFAGRCNCIFGILEFCGCCLPWGENSCAVGTYGVRGLYATSIEWTLAQWVAAGCVSTDTLFARVSCHILGGIS